MLLVVRECEGLLQRMDVPRKIRFTFEKLTYLMAIVLLVSRCCWSNTGLLLACVEMVLTW